MQVFRKIDDCKSIRNYNSTRRDRPGLTPAEDSKTEFFSLICQGTTIAAFFMNRKVLKIYQPYQVA